MRYLILVLCLILKGSLLFAQQEQSYIHKGNQLYQEQKYKEAEANYRKSVQQKNQSIPGNFNLGDALYKQKNYTDAAQKFNDIASTASEPAVKAQAYHNLGNSLFESKKLQESVDAYKKALLNNPKDDQTRYNLAYAMDKLKQQQQQQNKNDKNQNNKDKNKQNQNKDQNQQNKDKQDQNNKDQNKQDQNKQNQDQQNQDKQDKDKQDQQKEQQQPNKLSKEDAERMLEALNNEEKNTQDKLKNKKATGVKGRIVKDW